jgi:hypothetical protein
MAVNLKKHILIFGWQKSTSQFLKLRQMEGPDDFHSVKIVGSSIFARTASAFLLAVGQSTDLRPVMLPAESYSSSLDVVGLSENGGGEVALSYNSKQTHPCSAFRLGEERKKERGLS